MSLGSTVLATLAPAPLLEDDSSRDSFVNPVVGVHQELGQKHNWQLSVSVTPKTDTRQQGQLGLEHDVLGVDSKGPER